MATEFEILKTLAFHFSRVPPDCQAGVLRDLIRIIRPPRELLETLMNELPPTPAPAPAPPPPEERKLVELGTIFLS
jgi:hypothetical protein